MRMVVAEQEAKEREFIDRLVRDRLVKEVHVVQHTRGAPPPPAVARVKAPTLRAAQQARDIQPLPEGMGQHAIGIQPLQQPLQISQPADKQRAQQPAGARSALLSTRRRYQPGNDAIRADRCQAKQQRIIQVKPNRWRAACQARHHCHHHVAEIVIRNAIPG